MPNAEPKDNVEIRFFGILHSALGIQVARSSATW
jgi:hypothetical protein